MIFEGNMLLFFEEREICSQDYITDLKDFGMVQARVTLSVRCQTLKAQLDRLSRNLSLTQSVTLTKPRLNHDQNTCIFRIVEG